MRAGPAILSPTLPPTAPGIELLADPDNPQAAVMDQACAIHALEAALTPRLERDGLTADFDRHGTAACADSGEHGAGRGEQWTPTCCAKSASRWARRSPRWKPEIFELAGQTFSVGSTKQLQEVLFDKLKLPIGKKTKTGYSTGADVLEDLAAKGHEIARKIIGWREVVQAEIHLCRCPARADQPGDRESPYVA